MHQWIDPEQLEPLKPEGARHLGSFPYLQTELQRMNAIFIRAMAAAIRVGLERPPRVGIDRTPGTEIRRTFVRGAGGAPWRRPLRKCRPTSADG